MTNQPTHDRRSAARAVVAIVPPLPPAPPLYVNHLEKLEALTDKGAREIYRRKHARAIRFERVKRARVQREAAANDNESTPQ